SSSIFNSTCNSSTYSIFDDSTSLPEALALKLDTFASALVRNENVACPDLADFNIDDVESVETIKDLREELGRRMKNFDSAGTTDVNYETAAIAGAKLFVDERPATRNMTRKLAEEVGCNEGSLLYSALPSDVLESKAARHMADKRKEDIVESFIDFQKQLKFKHNILNHVVKKSEENVVQTRRRHSAHENMKTPPKNRLCRQAFTDIQRTPKKKSRQPDPLSYTRIMDNYADMLASEVKDRSVNFKRLEPIPFNLDSDDEDEAMEVV
uniref:Uncharacterized protein n=1 Tax=Panagrolaimus sp. ES5 TaxID=591445 RepID=A0AC34GFR8_9BILA